jgi:hypothetical protein
MCSEELSVVVICPVDWTRIQVKKMKYICCLNGTRNLLVDSHLAFEIALPFLIRNAEKNCLVFSPQFLPCMLNHLLSLSAQKQKGQGTNSSPTAIDFLKVIITGIPVRP